jgi:hypothetical protein
MTTRPTHWLFRRLYTALYQAFKSENKRQDKSLGLLSLHLIYWNTNRIVLPNNSKNTNDPPTYSTVPRPFIIWNDNHFMKGWKASYCMTHSCSCGSWTSRRMSLFRVMSSLFYTVSIPYCLAPDMLRGVPDLAFWFIEIPMTELSNS